MTQNPYRGILLAWSLSEGKGVTTLLKEWSYDLKKVIWIRQDPKPVNFDIKKLGLYYSLEKETRGFKRWQVGEWFIKLLDSIEKEDFDAIVIDTCYYFGECICAMVDKNPTLYRENYSSKPEFKWPQIKGEGHIWHSKVIARMAEMFQFVGLATHSMKTYNAAGVETGIYVPRVRPEVMKAASDIWLITPSENGNHCPTALISKQSPKSISTDRGERTLAILPKKITPQDKEISLWDCYERYYTDPLSAREKSLEDYEIPSLEEMSFISGNMTPDQKRIYDLAVKAKEYELQEAEVFQVQEYQEVKELVNKLIAKEYEPGDTTPDFIQAASILEEFQKTYPDYTEDDIKKMIGE